MEAVEKHRQMRGWNAIARVHDAEHDFFAHDLDTQVDALAGGCMAEGVADEVAENLLNGQRIGGPGQ